MRMNGRTRKYRPTNQPVYQETTALMIPLLQFSTGCDIAEQTVVEIKRNLGQIQGENQELSLIMDG